MNLDQIATKCFILALFIRDDGQRLLLGDGYYDFNQKLQHFQGNTIANDVVEIQGDNGQLLAGQVMRSGAQKFEGYIGDATTSRQIIEQKRSDFMAFFRIKHFYKVVYIFPDGTAIQRQRGYLTDAPTIPEIFQKFPEYSIALNFEDANYYEYAEDEYGDEIYAHIIELALAGGATGGLVWDAIGAVTNGISWSGIQTAQGEYIQVTNALDIPAKLASVEMLGKATQTTYSGKNLLPVSNPYANTGIKSYDIALPAGTYTLSFSSATTTGSVQASYFRVYDASNTDLATKTVQYADKKWTFTISSPSTKFAIYAQNTYAGSSGVTTTFTDIMLESGNQQTAYEPYVGGTPAPNQEFPMPTSAATGENAAKIEGKNLFNQGQYTGGTNYGITTTFATEQIKVAGTTDGTHYPTYIMYADGSTTQAQWWATASAINTAKGQFTDSGSYTLSIEAEGNISGHANGFEFILGYMDGTISGNQFVDQTTKKGSFTATKPINFIAFGFRPSLTFDTTFTIQLEKGTSASQFEPYQGQEFEVNLGKNLFKPYQTSGSITANGVTFTMNADGSITLNGNSTGNTWLEIVSDFRNGTTATTTPVLRLDPTATYTTSVRVKSGTFTGTPSVHIQKNATTEHGYYLNTTNAMTDADGLYRAWFRITSTDTFSNATIQIQLEKGSTATSFAPYFTPIELAKIGDYQDRIYKTDGKWYIEKQTQKLKLTSSINMSGGARFTNYQSLTYFYSNAFDSVLPTVDAVVSESMSSFALPSLAFYAGSSASVFNGNTLFAWDSNANNTNRLRLAIPTDFVGGSSLTDAQRLANWKTALDANDFYIVAPLQTPTTTEITNEALIAQLDALESASLYLGVNNIGTETQNAMPTLKIEYYTEYTLDSAGYEWEPGGNTAKTIVTVAGVDSAWPIWTIQGGAQNPTLTNITTGQTISWQGFVPEGQTLTINMAEMTADLAGANVFEYITGEWLRLAPGNNTLVYNAGNADKPSTLSWNGVLA